MVKQIGFYADENDEARLVRAIENEGAFLLPSCYPEWPFPVLRSPLPASTQPYMGAVVIWHPDIFREQEMLSEDNRPYNPAGKFFISNLWPVIELLRPLPVGPQAYFASLRLVAWYASFRPGRSLPRFSASEKHDFEMRAAELERLYRRLCSWIRHDFARLERGLFCGTSVKARLTHLKAGSP